MSTFDNREKGEERKHATSEAMTFKIESRRSKLLGLWLAEHMGLSGDAATSYAQSVVASDLEEPGSEDVLRKVMADIQEHGLALTEEGVRQKMVALLEEAKAQIEGES